MPTDVITAHRAYSTAEREISAAWAEYGQTEKYGLKFGKVCCKWRDKFKAQGNHSGKGFLQVLQEAGVVQRTAYWWMNEYEISIGKKNPLMSSETPEWYTPSEIIKRTELVLGKIDLDPCSAADSTVPAGHKFTREDNGLKFDWCGRVYMNPPYGREISVWVEKLISEYTAGRTKQAIALVPARVDTDWFRLFRDHPVCFVDGRLKFSGSTNSAPFPSAVVYLGHGLAAFGAAFKDLGDVWVRWDG